VLDMTTYNGARHAERKQEFVVDGWIELIPMIYV